MFYPAYIHHDPGSAFGATFPDLPGCFAAVDALGDLPTAAQEAFEVYLEGERTVPEPGDIENWRTHTDYQDGGYWMLLDLDATRANVAPRRINISLPGDLVDRIDAYTAANHLTRSGFLADAASRAIASRDDSGRRIQTKSPRAARKSQSQRTAQGDS